MDTRIVLKKWKTPHGIKYLMECLQCHKSFEMASGKYNKNAGRYCSMNCYLSSTKIHNLIGTKSGKLSIISFAFIRNKHRYLKCRCDCGTIKNIEASGLLLNSVVSCGCLARERGVQLGLSSKIHGLAGTRFYRIWQNMKRRCYSHSHKQFYRYGGRGISVCKKWHNFMDFYRDMRENYIEHEKKYGIMDTTLDRINNNKGYKLSNCHWATRKEQANNR